MPTPNLPRQQCRHIFPNGHRCGSPSLRRENFCYYHHTTRPPVQNLKQRRSREPFVLPYIEDQTSLQTALNQVLQGLASNDLDRKRAGVILYALQIAVQILPKGENLELPTAFTTRKDHRSLEHHPEQPIEVTILDPDHGLIAPVAVYRTPEERNRPTNFGTLLSEDHNRAPGTPRNSELIARYPPLQEYADHEAAEYLAALAHAAAEHAAKSPRPANLPPPGTAQPTTLPTLQANAAPPTSRATHTNRDKLTAHSSPAYSSQKLLCSSPAAQLPSNPGYPIFSDAGHRLTKKTPHQPQQADSSQLVSL